MRYALHRASRGLAVATSAAALITCASPSSPSNVPTSEHEDYPGTVTARNPIASVTVTLDATQLSVGATTQARATLVDVAQTVVKRKVSWRSSNTSIAAVTANGVVRALSTGNASIVAIVEGISGEDTLTVGTVGTIPVASVVVQLVASSITVGTSTTATATTLDANGTRLTGRVVSWHSANPAVATVTAGVVTGVAPGVANIVAESEGVQGQSALTVTTSSSSPPPPPPPPPTSDPILVEDFSTYTSVTNMLADPRDIWANAEGDNTSRIALDLSVGYGTSTKSMRYDWPNNGATCLDYPIRPGFLEIPGRPRHVWVEFVVRFSTNFRVDAGTNVCAREYKLAFLGDPGGIGRWNVPMMDGSQWIFGYPGNEAGYVSGTPLPATLWDGQPHVFRIEAKLGSASDGILKLWIDGALVRSITGFNTSLSHDEISWFVPGANMNQGPSISGMQMWWHRIAVFTTNPGW